MSAESPKAAGYHMPAEWAPHEATWITWPNSEDWPGKLSAVRWVYCDIIRKLSRTERVRVLVPSQEARSAVRASLERAGSNSDAVQLFVAETNRTWARDNLPLFLVKAKAASGGTPSQTEIAPTDGLGAAKFRFNGWARYPDFELDDAAGHAVARAAAADVFTPSYMLDGEEHPFVLEGGSVDVDGEGTLLTTRRCLLGSPFTRNPGLDQTAVEAVLEASLGISKVIWLEDGVAGDDTSGHIDDFARFVRPSVVVCARESNPKDDNYQPLQAALEALRGATDAQGRKLSVVELPVPGPVYFDGERLPASYANFYIANEQVLVPTFNDPHDRTALGILSELFPDRQVTGIHALDLVVGLGTLHCSTQQQPLV